MQDQLTMERLGSLRGAPVYDLNSEKIGKVEEIFYDLQTGMPEWIGLGTGFFGTRRMLVPAAGAETRDDGVLVRYAKEQVKDSPDIDADEISPALERSLHDYYGVAPTTTTRETEPVDGGSVTRREEELKVGTRDYEAGHVRLRKWVEHEPVQTEVELTHERARIEREPINEPVSRHEFREEEIEVPLHAEEPVVEKQAVAKERITIGKETARETQTVSETLRKEQVAVEHDGVENVDEVE